MRSFNVYSEQIILWAGEVFNFILNANEVSTGDSVVLTSSDWPLPPGPYTVKAGTPFAVTAGTVLGAQGTFTCTPPAPDVTTQTVMIAAVKVDICTDVSVNPGEHFIWENAQSSPVLISPDPDNDNFWPLPDQEHWVPAKGWLVVQVPADAQSGTNYTIKLTMNGKPFSCNPMGTQPKIIIGSNR
jgi:hypothetical protein